MNRHEMGHLMDDPAGEIIAALNDSIDDCTRCKTCGTQDDVIRAAVASVLAKRDAEIARLQLAADPTKVELVGKLVHHHSRLVTIERDDARQCAEQAEKREAEIREDRDQMWAEVQKLRETVLALETQVGDLAAERNKYIGELRRQVDPVAALAQPGDQAPDELTARH
jgi:hypothetical protein